VRWRAVPAEAVYRAGLAVGVPLDRSRARTVGRELRRQQALDLALRSLGRRDHTTAELEQRLSRRGVARVERDRTLALLDRVGLVSDARFAAARAALLVDRGSGDLLIADDLERRGVAPEVIADVIAALDPEADRAERIVAARGASLRTLRALSTRGFSEAALESLVAQLEDGALG
jgi:regulatory protein